jgi:kynureninase
MMKSTEPQSIETILHELSANCEDLENSLDLFVQNRSQILRNQKLALARYESELLEIEARNANIGDFNPKYVLHKCVNLFLLSDKGFRC